MKIRWIVSLGLLGCASCCTLASADSLMRLHSFGAANAAAANPFGRLIQASDGLLYGTTSTGGQTGQGVIFRMSPDGSIFTQLKSLGNGPNDGLRPFGALLEGADGALYGTTEAGGQSNLGTVFKIGKDGSGFTVLKSFSGGSDGANPEAALVQGSDGLLYGSASGGGTNDNGVVFRMAKDGSGFATLVQFSGTNGANPESELIEASDGMLYGTTIATSTNNIPGTVFRLQKDGTGFSVLARFLNVGQVQTNGAMPQARLVEGTNGMLYGTTSSGGTKGMGTIYQLNKDGTGFEMLYHFGTNSTDARSPLGDLRLGSDGMLYGTTFDGGTNGYGTVFTIAQDGTGFAILSSLVSPQGPAAGLIEGTNGILYGTSQFGGVFGDGTVFALPKDGSSFAILKSFSASGEDGVSPYASPVAAATNELFGTTRLGGSLAAGSVYRVRFDGPGLATVSSLATTSGPVDVVASLLASTNGTLLGVSRFGGSATNGTIFSLDQSGSNLAVIYSPTDSTTGQEFRGGLIQASDGLLYGTSVSGGTSGGGTVFRMNADGSGFTVLKSFVLRGGVAGENPMEPLLEASDGNLYGTTYAGGTTNRGVLFTMPKDGSSYTVLKNFGIQATDGESPMSPLLEASDGMLYGSAYGGGPTNNAGTIFRINKDGTSFQVIKSFAATDQDGRHPCGALAEAADGSLYGTTERGGANDQGAIFRVNKDGSGYAVLASLGGVLGVYPRGGLTLGPDGALYGTTDQGGDMGFGTLFRFGTSFGDIATLQITNQVPTITSIGLPGTNYVLQRTLQLGPLASWTTVLSTNAPATGRFSVADQAAAAGADREAFYRLKR